MNTSHALMTLWISPRKTIQQLTLSWSLRSDLNQLIILTLGYFLQMTLFALMINVIPMSVFFSQRGLQAQSWGILMLGTGFYTYANLTAYMLGTIVKWFKGSGSIASNRTGVLWSMMSFLPVGLSILLIYFAYSQRLLDHPIYLLDIVSVISFPLVFIYSFILTLKIIAEINQFSLWRAFFSILLCWLIQGMGAFVLISLLRS